MLFRKPVNVADHIVAGSVSLSIAHLLLLVELPR